MSLEIWLGEAGGGKSTLLRQEIINHALAHPEMRHLLLVPEQFCLSAQQKLVALHPRHTLINIEALSFDRLAARCFRELNAETADIITDTAKTMFVALAVKDCKGQLNLYGKQALRPGFIGRLSSLFAEWTMNDIAPERLTELAGEEGLPLLLRRKLADLSLLFAAFRKRLGDKQTAEELLPRFARLLPRSSVGRADCLYLDGFTGFTSVQYRILETMLKRCPHSKIVLTMPAGGAGEAPGENREDLFALSRITVERLKACAERAGRLTELHFFARGVEKDAERQHLARHLFRAGKAAPWQETPQHLTVTACPGPAEEALLAVRLIRRMVGEGFRYRDIAITVSDQNLYLPLLLRELERAGIPFFSDRREPLRNHPLIRLIKDALRAVSEGMEREAVLNVLKNPAGPFSMEECDRFENYCLAAGVRRGKAFMEPFTRLRRRRRGETPGVYEERALAEREEMEGLRQRGLEPLLRLKTDLGRMPRAQAGSQALRRFLADLDLPESLERLEEERLGLGDQGASWQEALAQVEGFLDNLESILKDMPLSLKEFSEMIGAALEGMTSGRLPMRPDQILIGDLQRSRLGDLRSLLFLGLNENLVPKTRGEGRLISDQERLALSFFEEELGYTDEKALAEERFYLYSLLLKPRENLYLSFARRGFDSDKEQLPAFVIKELQNLFPALQIQAFQPKEARTEPPQESGFQPILLASAVPESLYGKELHSSISGLEKLADCPYAFFMSRGLALEERQELGWDNADHGLLFHKVAELMLGRMSREGIEAEKLSREEKEGLVRQSLEEALQTAEGSTWENTAERRYSLDRWQRFFVSYLEYLGEKGLKDGFVPREFELRFDARKAAVTRLSLKENRALQLSGVIDRIDLKEDAGHVFLRVVDYKTRKQTAFNPGALVEGTQLQLPVYLDIALRLYEKTFPGKSLRPGGMCYGSLAEQTVDWKDTPEKIRSELWKRLDLSGLQAAEALPVEDAGRKSPSVSTRTLELTAAYAREKIVRLAEEVYAGDITPTPRGDRERGSCSYCAYQPLCPFDESRKGCSFRKESLSSREAWQEIIGSKEEKEAADEVQS